MPLQLHFLGCCYVVTDVGISTVELRHFHSKAMHEIHVIMPCINKLCNPVMMCKIGGFHGSDYEECHLLGCYGMWLL
jgi:hypothetical protein